MRSIIVEFHVVVSFSMPAASDSALKVNACDTLPMMCYPELSRRLFGRAFVAWDMASHW